ncbi:hypothetical protein D3C75_426620 [compost metagenome]
MPKPLPDWKNTDSVTQLHLLQAASVPSMWRSTTTPHLSQRNLVHVALRYLDPLHSTVGKNLFGQSCRDN